MKFRLHAVLCALLCAPTSTLAESTWRTLPNSPNSGTSRFEDLHFVDDDTGWVVSFTGKIFKTASGGTAWEEQLAMNEAFRSVTFVDAQRGWVGSGFDVNLLFETFDGGDNWSVVPNLPTPRPGGICALQAVDANTVYGFGKWAGPAHMIKTTDAGATWTSAALAPHLDVAIDAYFVDANTGIVVGGVGLPYPSATVSRVILTEDGGATWQTLYTGTRAGEWGWKIDFPTPLVGYVSLERYAEPGSYFLKTEDGGQSWQTLSYGSGSLYRQQGIGFASPDVGWLGGHAGLARSTTDGGATWSSTDWGNWLNRIFWRSPTLAYAVGADVYKFSEYAAPTSVDAASPVPLVTLGQNYPNPFNPTTVIPYYLDEESDVRILVYDPRGRLLDVLVDQLEGEGHHVAVWDGTDRFGAQLPSGVYFYRVDTGRFSEVKRMVMLR